MTDDVKQSESYVNSIVKQEHEALGERSRSERLADTVASFAGSFSFIALHLVFVTCWVFANSGNTAMADPLDPYPFSLLGVIVALEAVILSSFVLMRQNRMMRRADHRDHLNLQVDLLAEKEITKVLQMVRGICEHMGLQNLSADSEARDLSENTSVESISQKLKDRLPKT
jgi:uncharacterized membrane protein